MLRQKFLALSNDLFSGSLGKLSNSNFENGIATAATLHVCRRFRKCHSAGFVWKTNESTFIRNGGAIGVSVYNIGNNYAVYKIAGEFFLFEVFSK